LRIFDAKWCKNIYNNEANQNNCKETDSSIIECLKKEGPTSEASNPTTKFHGPKDTKNLYKIANAQEKNTKNDIEPATS
jgi:hypothetical protein